MTRPVLALLAALATTAGLAFAAAPAAQADVVWLCRPGLADDPCRMPLTTTVRELDGSESVRTPQADADPGIDCFYVYPTVSNQLTPNATLSRDPELASIARYQAARFSQHCRVFAPVYRQSTLASIATGYLAPSGADRQLAYGDVLEAWRTYLDRDNGGRGVVLIGHSQGTAMLRQLLRREIEREPGQLRRVVSAILLGGNVTVRDGDVVGGDFRVTPLCTRRAQLRCVVAFSTFAEDPPADTRFGRSAAPPADNPSTLPGGPGHRVACTDPRPLAGMDGPLRALQPSEAFAPGLIAVGILFTYRGLPPSASTPWVVPRERFEGGCRTINGADVLRIEPVGDSQRPNWYPEPRWGTHLVDVNLGLEPLVTLVGRQARRWTAPDLRLTRRCVGAGRLRVALVGGEAEYVRRVGFKLGRRLVSSDPGPRFERTLSRRSLRAFRGREVRAVAELTAGPARVVLARTLPRCGAR